MSDATDNQETGEAAPKSWRSRVEKLTARAHDARENLAPRLERAQESAAPVWKRTRKGAERAFDTASPVLRDMGKELGVVAAGVAAETLESQAQAAQSRSPQQGQHSQGINTQRDLGAALAAGVLTQTAAVLLRRAASKATAENDQGQGR